MFQLNPEGLTHHEQVWTQHVWAGETLLSAGHAAQHSLNDIQEVSVYHITLNLTKYTCVF